jgi:hypothetical protein
MKRRLVKLVVFVLAGVIVNVAVAWAIAWSIRPEPQPHPRSMEGAYWVLKWRAPALRRESRFRLDEGPPLAQYTDIHGRTFNGPVLARRITATHEAGWPNLSVRHSATTAAPGSVRRRMRIRRGLCPACAYPVGQSDVCTECGRPVRPTVA